MTTVRRADARAILRRLHPVTHPHLVARYRRAQEYLGLPATRLDAFRVDAAGWSPEVAAEAGDPGYLAVGAGHPALVILSVEQLDAPLVRPDLGLGAFALAGWLEEARPALAGLALGEPVLGRLDAGLSRVAAPGQLGLVRELTLRLATPSERLVAAAELEELGARLLGEEEAWTDDALLARIRELAGRTRGLAEVPAVLRAGRRLPAGPAFVPAFGGCHVFPGADAGGKTRAWVLFRPGGGADAEGFAARAAADGVRLHPRTVESVAHFLVARGLVDPAPEARELAALDLDGLHTWVAAHTAAPRGARRAGSLIPLGGHRDVSPELEELEDVRLRVRAGEGRVDLGRYSAITRLRLMPRRVAEPAGSWWVEHLRASLDPALRARFLADPPGPLSGLFTGPRGEDLLAREAAETREEVAA